MAIDALEVRMARLEGGYEQISERLGAIEQRLGSLDQRLTAFEQRVSSEIASLRSEMATRSDLNALRVEMRGADSELRRQMNPQFFWVLTFILGSILIPILPDFAR